MKSCLAFLAGLTASIGPVLAANTTDYTCSETKPCDLGCCSKRGLSLTSGSGVCGLGPKFCASDVCISSCDYKSECDPGWGMQWSNTSTCPLNVCCSQYGFCGTTSEFCGSATVSSPSCSGTSSDARTMGYYEGWNLEHACDTMTPNQIPLGYYTHLNFAFGSIDPDSFQIAPMASDVAALYQNVTVLKQTQPDLKVWISIGGWSFNDDDQPTKTTFSDLAASESAQKEFFASLITFMVQNGFDGVDIDWEYPAADDRNGRPEDYKNYPIFLNNLRKALDGTGLVFGLSITIPSSYWYMQHFDIVSMDPIIDWFNIMTYDLHGTWDGNDPYIGANALAHTNLTEIEQSLELLWRNNIDPAKVNLGLGFYGRSFTMSDPDCLHAGCPFKSGGKAGPCTATSGILSDAEIKAVIAAGATVTLDEAAAVKIVTWDTDQWVSYDDAETMKMKIDFANQHCLGGTMLWAVDMDTTNGSSINALGSDLSRAKSPTYANNATVGMDAAWS
ncbi:chitinase [Aspergillus uvarum CBS 121591]|uniref:chitinase n=1 Tax=Aspergillus uvarum CBS 121591 TaxID=1448315 RepID=A0A319C9G1_9EURO|nr:chitinase [Aspergillus uvarum CBS 121591]PYH81904.1 chitinase [Aspergillus uvarum CBS 121591]